MAKWWDMSNRPVHTKIQRRNKMWSQNEGKQKQISSDRNRKNECYFILKNLILSPTGCNVPRQRTRWLFSSLHWCSTVQEATDRKLIVAVGWWTKVQATGSLTSHAWTVNIWSAKWSLNLHLGRMWRKPHCEEWKQSKRIIASIGKTGSLKAGWKCWKGRCCTLCSCIGKCHMTRIRCLE